MISRLQQVMCALWLLTAITQVHAAPNAVYDSNCALCHQQAGAGLVGQFPNLAGRAYRIASNADGRRYLVQVVLYGLAGKIDVDGATINGVMPPFTARSDAELASVLSYLIKLGGPAAKKIKAISAQEVSKIRAEPALNIQQMKERRAALVAAGQIPAMSTP